MAKTGIVTLAANTSNGTQDFRCPGLTETPTAAIWILTPNTAYDTPVGDAQINIGFVTGSAQFGAYMFNEDGVNPSNSFFSSFLASDFITLVDNSENIIADGIFSAWLSDNGSGAGIRVNWIDAPPAGYLGTFIFFVALDQSVGVYTPGDVDEETTATIDFQPNLFFFLASLDSYLSMGIADANLSQAGVFYYLEAGSDPQILSSQLMDGYVIGKDNLDTGDPWRSALFSISGTGFVMKQYDNAGSGQVGFLALRMDLGAVVSVEDSPASSGLQSFSSTLIPELIFQIITNMTAVNTGYTDNKAGSFGLSAFNETDEVSANVASEDNVSTTNAQSLLGDVANYLTDDDGAELISGSFDSFDEDDGGWSIDYSASVARKIITLVLGEEVPTPEPTPGETPSNITATTATSYQSLALPVLVSDPLWWADRRGYITTLWTELSGLSFTTTDDKGYDKATLPLRLSRLEYDDWLLDGLGRHIVIKNESGVTIWRGFVNLIRYQLGGKTKTIGPLLEMANKVSGDYSFLDTTTDPPTRGEQTSTGLLEDTDSQERYGIIEQTLSLGSTTDDLALRATTKFLNKKRFQPTTTDESFSGGDLELTLECLGYYYLFDSYTYSDDATGETDLSSQLTDVIQAYPLFSQVFSDDLSRITENTLQVPYDTDGSPRAKALIEEYISFGDEDDNRYIFGVWDEGQIVYEIVENEITYLYRLGDRKQEIEDVFGGHVWPWNVQPGRWLRTPDFLPGRSQPDNLREDIRNSYIVSVSFTAPYGLQLGGDEMDELPQMLAKIQRGVNLNG